MWSFITPGSFTHFIVKGVQSILAVSTIFIIQIRIAKIEPNFLPCGFQFIIRSIFQKISEFILAIE